MAKICFSTNHLRKPKPARKHSGLVLKGLALALDPRYDPRGLILTGKSIARFAELKEQFAEYFLIGSAQYRAGGSRRTNISKAVVRDYVFKAMFRDLSRTVHFRGTSAV